MNDQSSAILPPLASFCAAQRVDAWLVGGTVRDMVLGSMPHDIDIAVDADGLVLARQFADNAGGAFVALDDERGTGRVVLPAEPHAPPNERLTIDFVRLRAATLEEDLRLRDFTVNALALPLAHAATASHRDAPDYIDPCGGLDDIHQRVLRPCLPTSLTADPLRTLRAIRLAAALDLHVVPELHTALREATPLIDQVAVERVRDELLKLLALPHAARWLRYMDIVGLLTRIFPELEPARTCDQPVVHFLPVLAHSLETVVCLEWLLEPFVSDPVNLSASAAQQPAAVQTYPDLPRTLPYGDRLRAHFTPALDSSFHRAALFKLAALLHDNAKPQTKHPKPGGGVTFYGHQEIGADVARTIARRLHLSKQATTYIALVVRQHMRPGQLRNAEHVTPRAIARFFRDTGSAGVDVLLHTLADHLAARGPHLDVLDWRDHLAWTARMLAAHWEKPPEQHRPLLTGHDIMAALGIGPGKLVGELLTEVQEAQDAGELSTADEALELARQRYAGHM